MINNDVLRIALYIGSVSNSYEGESAKKIREAFKNAVNDYLRTCIAENLIPEKPHEKSTMVALDLNMELNKFVKTAINHEVERFQSKKAQIKFMKNQRKLIAIMMQL